MNCPKCGSANVLAAPDEVPIQARSWMKCWACGKRWDPAGALPTAGDDEDDDEQDQEPADQPLLRRKRTADEVMDLVMSEVRAHRGESKEDEMPKFVSEEHRRRWIEGQRAAREAKKKKLSEGGGIASAETKAPVRRGWKPKAAVPAIATAKAPTRSNGHAAISVLPPAGPDALCGLDAAIEAMRSDLASLERAREILQQRTA